MLRSFMSGLSAKRKLGAKCLCDELVLEWPTVRKEFETFRETWDVHFFVHVESYHPEVLPLPEEHLGHLTLGEIRGAKKEAFHQ